MGRSAEGCFGGVCSPAGCGDEGLPAGIGKGCVSMCLDLPEVAAGSGGPCPAKSCAAVAQPRQSLLAPCWSRTELLQVGQAATASSVPQQELQRDWENTPREQAAVQANPAAEFAGKLIP